MKPIAIDEFCHLKFISNPAFSPDGSNFCLTVSECDLKNNDYRSCIYRKNGNGFAKLTSGGKESSFVWLDNDTIAFQSNREKQNGKSIESHYYRISLNGGEAEKLFTFPIPTSAILPLPDGNFVVIGTTYPGFEELYRNDPKLTKAYLQHCEENEDYVEIAENPWWKNGTDFLRGQYSTLFYYDVKKGKLTPLTGPELNLRDAKLAPNGKVFFQAMYNTRLVDINVSSIYEFDPEDMSVSPVVVGRDDLILYGYEPGEHFLAVFAADDSYGCNTDPDFYRVDYTTGRRTLICRYDFSIESSVGADIRYGGGRITKMVGDTLYFISTRGSSSNLYRLDGDVITPVIERDGAIDCFDISDGHILCSSLFDMKAQELYDESGKQVSHFNDKQLRGKYVAVPEPLNIRTGGHEVHGFVLKPINFREDKKYPVIFDIHGGPKAVFGKAFYHEMQYWAGLGYFVIYCNPTGSDGRGGEFSDMRNRYGSVDYDDLMAFCDEALDVYPQMYPDALYETGGSYGGFMTNWIIGHTDRFRAVASQRSISNWFSMYGISDIGVSFSEDQCDCTPWSDPEKMWSFSPMKYADRVTTPTLFIHSFEDYRCPIDQGYQMFTSLLEHGVDTKMVCFKGENHELSRSGKPKHRIKRLEEITKWFASH